MRLFELTELQPFSTEPNTPNQMDMMKDPGYMSKKKGMVGEIVWMSPSDYIDRCVEGFKRINEPGRVRQGRDPKLVKQYAHDMKKGDKFPMLELDYRGGFGQEGLHRAMAAEMIGVNKVPVFITKESPEFAAKREAHWKKTMAAMKKAASPPGQKDLNVVNDILGAFDESVKESSNLQSGEHRWKVEYKDGSTEEVIAGKTAFSVRRRLSGSHPPPSAKELGIKKVHRLSDPNRRPKGSFGFSNRGYTHDMRAAKSKEDDILSAFESKLTEGISPIVYHYMGIRNAASVLQQNKFRLTASPGTGAEKALQKGDRMYYLSTTRHKLGGYHIDNSWSGVIFELDGSKLAQNHAGKAVDYWGPEFYGQPGGKGPEKKEAEDRVYSYEPYIENANRYIKSVHVLYDEKGQESHKQMAIDVRRMFITAKRMGVPAYLYTDKQDWLVHDTRKAVNPADVPVIAQAKGGERDKGKTYGNATTRRQISPWVELYMAPVGSKISKEAEKTRYNYVLYGYSDAAQSLSADIHNAKSKPADETGLGTLLKIFRKEKIKSPQEYLDLLKDKWAPKDES